jgi:hypothetical protein
MLLVFLVSASLFTACDSSDSNDPARGEFARSYRDVTQDYRTATTNLQAESSTAVGQGMDTLLGVYENYEAAISDALDSYQELDPPDDFADPFDDMVAALGRQEEVLQELIDAARDQDSQEVAEAAGQLTQLTAQWNTARQEVEEKLAECGEPCDS